MPKRVRLRSVSEQEQAQLRKLVASRTAPVRLVQRARLIQAMLDDPSFSAAEAARSVGFDNPDAGARWVRRFNEGALAALEDRPRSGRPAEHDQVLRGKLVSLALQKPRSLGYPFALWTLERLQGAFHEREGVHLASSTIWEYIEAEGLTWKRQQSWFHEPQRHDPEFVEKRGLSSAPTSLRPNERV
jgi:transposase